MGTGVTLPGELRVALRGQHHPSSPEEKPRLPLQIQGDTPEDELFPQPSGMGENLVVAQDAPGDIWGQGERNTGELWLRTTDKWRCSWSACFPA